MEKEELLFQKRIMDLAQKSYQSNCYTFSTFLSIAEQDIILSLEKELSFSTFSFFGGGPQSERKIVRFGSPEELGYEEPFPICCIHIMPLIEKFADDLSHRDFLGALMNLSIERNTIGDIMLQNKSAFLFCHEKMAEYIIRELDQVKHTHVRCILEEPLQEQLIKEPVRKEILVSSVRIDAVIAKLYNISRTESLNLFRSKKIFVNGRTVENNSYMLKSGDAVTARGFGKFDYLEEIYHTKKDKKGVAVAKYE